MLISTGCKPKQLKTFELSDITEDHVKKKKNFLSKKTRQFLVPQSHFQKLLSIFILSLLSIKFISF